MQKKTKNLIDYIIFFFILAPIINQTKFFMKKLILSASLLTLLFSCQKEDSANQVTTNQKSADASVQRVCASQDVLIEQLKADPSLAGRMNQIESFTQDFVANHKNDSDATMRLVNGQIQIPVVVNVLYRTTAENISQSQIQSQIDALNRDYTATNSDFNTSDPFTSVKGNVGITFVLDQVIRKATTKSSWGTTDGMKKTSTGGLAPTSPTTKLNLWACTIGGGILGYAQFPGGASSTDGVAIDSKYFGTNGTATYPYNLGRTATHEVGHWMNLRHIWGDAQCGSDLVTDTPTHDSPNFGVPAAGHRSTCSGTPLEMYMNYMDYTDDRGMYMFSKGQATRMNAVFAVGGSRSSFR